MNFANIGAALVGLFIIFILIKQRGGIKALMERSKDAPQHWGTYALLMLAVVALVYILIKL